MRQYGFQNTTLEMIGKEASVTPAQLHRNFSDMEVIVAALAIDHLEMIEADIKRLGHNADPIAIATVLLERAKYWTVNGEESVFFNLLAEAERNPCVGRVIRKGLYYLRTALSASISKGQLHATTSSGGDAGSYALQISIMVQASVIARLFNTEAEAERVNRLFLEMLEPLSPDAQSHSHLYLHRIRKSVSGHSGRRADRCCSPPVGRIAGTRELVIDGTPFVEAYAITETAVHILRVLHGAQEWPDTLPAS